jgi:hypothetical protein
MFSRSLARPIQPPLSLGTECEPNTHHSLGCTTNIFNFFFFTHALLSNLFIFKAFPSTDFFFICFGAELACFVAQMDSPNVSPTTISPPQPRTPRTPTGSGSPPRTPVGSGSPPFRQSTPLSPLPASIHMSDSFLLGLLWWVQRCLPLRRLSASSASHL